MLDPDNLPPLWTEIRDDGSIVVLRVQDSVTKALQTSDMATLARVAQRALTYAEFAGAEPELITDFLAGLAKTAVHEGLYARMIIPAGAIDTPRARSLRGLVALAALGIAGSIALGVFLAQVEPGILGLASAVGVATTMPLIFTLRARATQRTSELDPGAALVRVAADAKFFANQMSAIDHFVTASSPIPTISRTKDMYLSADPAGLILRVGQTELARIPGPRSSASA